VQAASGLIRRAGEGAAPLRLPALGQLTDFLTLQEERRIKSAAPAWLRRCSGLSIRLRGVGYAAASNISCRAGHDQNPARFLRVCDRSGEHQRQCKRGRESSRISPHRTLPPEAVAPFSSSGSFGGALVLSADSSRLHRSRSRGHPGGGFATEMDWPAEERIRTPGPALAKGSPGIAEGDAGTITWASS
jgi:hypothetical protein